ncbi:MAG: hypothetical protein US50_C0053G0005 [Candidatus Nomurabacteria bacterium GW2011_GWB1_37_5]|uniref:Uncharacterized protein n=1 Tax=Candidatus Nomurabacteria bacterium GW2011_GWB1_37_5 TaxID=1618742 RepID=A0A0G0JC16_9BACT|nr:MAG: hypothetical protein US50_C0053G0005 [Candidatus Nomurabacteria bacterium GW2011_GWB1_37_5]
METIWNLIVEHPIVIILIGVIILTTIGRVIYYSRIPPSGYCKKCNKALYSYNAKNNDEHGNPICRFCAEEIAKKEAQADYMRQGKTLPHAKLV